MKQETVKIVGIMSEGYPHLTAYDADGQHLDDSQKISWPFSIDEDDWSWERIEELVAKEFPGVEFEIA